jgi:hypothetical protein
MWWPWPWNSTYPERKAEEVDGREYDYIIIGGRNHQFSRPSMPTKVNSVTQVVQQDVFLRLASRKTLISLFWSLSGESQTILGFLESRCWEVICWIRGMGLLFGILSLLRIVGGRRGGLLEGMLSTYEKERFPLVLTLK